MIKVLLVGLGGLLGSIFRYLISGLVHQIGNGGLFPYGTLAVNTVGCVAFGFLAGLSETRGVFTGEARGFIFIGLLGGFTTFSTFSFETVTLLQDLKLLAAFSNVLLHAMLGFGGVWIGFVLARTI